MILITVGCFEYNIRKDNYNNLRFSWVTHYPIEELHNNKVDLTEKWIDDNKDKVPKQSKDKIKDYKKIPKTYKKKKYLSRNK